MFYFFMMLCASCVIEAMFQTRHRGCQSWIQVIFVAAFMGLGWLYIIFQAVLIIMSLFKIATGTVGGWVVTARKAQNSTLPKAEEISTGGDEEAPRKRSDSGIITVHDESTCEGSDRQISEEASEPDQTGITQSCEAKIVTL